MDMDMNMKQAERMSIFKAAVFGQLIDAANKQVALGKKIIDLSLGSPDLPPHEKIRKTLSEKSKQADMYGYTLTGLKKFNEAVADYYKRTVNVQLNPTTEVLQTMGSQEGLVHLPLAFCNEGDVVLTTNPAYIAYDAGIKLAGAQPYYMPLRAENNFLPDLDAIPNEVAEKASLMILNMPGNPVPAMPDKAFFEKVIAFAKKYKILVLHDAAYSEYYFSGDKAFSFLAVEGAKDLGLEINSLSKSFSLAGARIAYFVGNAKAIEILRRLKSNLDYGVFAPIQEAAITALNNAEEITADLRAVFRARHQVMTKGLQENGWQVAPSDGGMFVWAKYPQAMSDQDFVLHAIEESGIMMVPGSAFGSEGEGYVRIALVQDLAILKEAVKRLAKL